MNRKNEFGWHHRIQSYFILHIAQYSELLKKALQNPMGIS